MAAEKIARIRLPWMTVTFVLLAVGIYYSPDLSQRLIFDRPLILVGEWWRVPASSLVHYSTMHLFWNLLALFVLGAVLESWNRTALFWLAVLSLSGNSLFLFDPGIRYFSGASGLVMAIAGYCCIEKIMTAELKIPWIVLFGALSGKIIYEFMAGTALFAGGNFRVLPEAHLLGLVSAVVLFFLLPHRGKWS